MSAFRSNCSPLVEPGTIDHMADDMTVTFAADVTLPTLQAKLAEKNQWLPIDGGVHDEGVLEDRPELNLPLGEMVLRNSTGPLRLGFGAWRDLLLGAQFTNGRGELISAGGRVLKNVAGYDVTKFLVGSRGVFGKPVCFTARTWKRPAAALHADAAISRADLPKLLASPLRPHWIIEISLDSMLLGYLGDPDAIQHYRKSVAQLSPSRLRDCDVDDDAWQRYRLWPINTALARISVPPSQVGTFVQAARIWPYMADPAFGIVLSGRGMPVDVEKIRAAASAVGGRATFLDAAGQITEMSIDPAAYAILARLKTAFDPDGKLPPLPPNRA